MTTQQQRLLIHWLHRKNQLVSEDLMLVQIWTYQKLLQKVRNGTLLPKLFWPAMRKNCFSDWEKLLKFEAEGRGFAKILRSLENYV